MRKKVLLALVMGAVLGMAVTGCGEKNAQSSGKLKEIQSLEAANGVSYTQACGGIIITYKDGLYGAVDYTGKEIVPNVHNMYFNAPNKEGQFALGSQEQAIVFDKDGRELLAIQNPYLTHISENVVSYLAYESAEDQASNTWANAMTYDLNTGVSTSYDQGWTISELQDGAFYLSGDVLKYVSGGESQYLLTYISGADLDSEYGIYLHCDMNDGYGAVSSQLNRAGVADAAFSNVLLVDMDRFFVYKGIPENASWQYSSFYDGGQYHANLGTQFAVTVAFPNNTVRYYWFDMSDAEYTEKNDGSGAVYKEYSGADFSDILVGEYDCIELSSSGVYLASDGTGWMYVDGATGKILAAYDDASSFTEDGYALVIKDGVAYVIDRSFQKVSGDYTAEGVYCAGDALALVNQDTTTYLFVQE